MAKIGILGGTFDPVHKGHLMLGEEALRQFSLEEVWFMPSGQPPHKRGRHITDGALRGKMVRLALEGKSGLKYSGFELGLPGLTYTARTLFLLSQTYPMHTFYFIVGADSLYQIEGWFHPDEIMGRAVLLAAGRPYGPSHRSLLDQKRYLEEKYGAHIGLVRYPEMDISSEQVRRVIADGADEETLGQLVPPAVASFIIENGLYRTGEEGYGKCTNPDHDV